MNSLLYAAIALVIMVTVRLFKKYGLVRNWMGIALAVAIALVMLFFLVGSIGSTVSGG